MDVELAVAQPVSENGSPMVDATGRDVLAFASEIRNLSRTAALVDMIVEMHESGKWRKYETAVGPEEWRECEYDYFLIACQASYDDISRVLAWNKSGRALGSAMESDEPEKRRRIEEAAQGWHSTSGESLLDRAVRQGWTNERGRLRPPPVPERARAKLRHGVTMDEYARRRREERIPADRRGELDQRLGHLLEGLSDLEIRYVRDAIASKIKRRRQTSE
jgi:hypothetical protein